MLERQNRLDIEVIYYNVSTNSLFITFISFLLTYYAWKSSGWGVLTKLILIISVLLLFVTIALFFSRFSRRNLMIEYDMIIIGKRIFLAKEVKKIECYGLGRALHIHIIGVDETFTFRLKEKDRLFSRKYIYKWCGRYNIPFVER